MNAWLDPWPAFAADVVAAIDTEWVDHCDSLKVWTKSDRSVVSDLDLRLDVAIREAFARHYPTVPVLSEELGWRYGTTGRTSNIVGIVDSIDGTESLIHGELAWWTSVALVRDGQPVAGLIRQPVRQITFDSLQRATSERSPANFVGLSPDRIADHRERNKCLRLEAVGFAVASTPHAVEKVAAVLEGRCAGAIAVPSEKSPTWRSWDVAACIAIAATHDLLLLDTTGEPLKIRDVERSYDSGWVCARDETTWEAARSAWFDE